MWDELNAKIGASIRFQRSKKLKITQEELAQRVGISRPSIANIESGRQQITVVQLLIFAQVLQVSPAELLPKVHPAGPHVPASVGLEGGNQALREWADRLLENG